MTPRNQNWRLQVRETVDRGRPVILATMVLPRLGRTFTATVDLAKLRQFVMARARAHGVHVGEVGFLKKLWKKVKKGAKKVASSKVWKLAEKSASLAASIPVIGPLAGTVSTALKGTRALVAAKKALQRGDRKRANALLKAANKAAKRAKVKLKKPGPRYLALVPA